MRKYFINIGAIIVVSLILKLIPCSIDAQTYYTDTPSTPPYISTDGTVNVMLIHNDILYIGGEFSQITVGFTPTLTPSLTINPTVIATASATPDIPLSPTDFPPVTTNIVANNLVAIDLTTNDVAQDDNSLDWLPNPNAPVYDMNVVGDKLFVGGDFTTISTLSIDRMAYFDTTTLLPSTWNPGFFGGAVLSIASVGDEVIAGGVFTAVNTDDPYGSTTTLEPRSGIASFDFDSTSVTEGYATTFAPELTGFTESWAGVVDIHVDGSTIFIGGDFTIDTSAVNNSSYVGTALTNQFRYNIASFNDTGIGTADFTDWAPNVSYDYSVGFTTPTPTPVSATTFSGLVWKIETDSDTIFIGGNFLGVNDVFRGRFAAFDKTTGNLEPFAPTFFGTVWDIDNDTDQYLYVAGYYNWVEAEIDINNRQEIVNTYGVSLFDTEVLLPGWKAEILDNAVNPEDGFVRTIYLDEGTYPGVYLGGNYNQVDSNTTFDGFTQFETTGSTPTAYPTQIPTATNSPTPSHSPVPNPVFNLNPLSSPTIDGFTTNGPVYALYKYGEILFVGGDFTQVTRQDSVNGDITYSRTNIAAIDYTNSQIGDILVWSPDVNDIVREIHVDDDYVYIAGDFTSVNSQSRDKIAAFVNNGINYPLHFWNPDISYSLTPTNYDVNAITSTNKYVYVGGFFDKVNGKNIKALAVFDKNNNLQEVDWSPGFDAPVNDLAIANGFLYAGGQFTSTDIFPTPTPSTGPPVLAVPSAIQRTLLAEFDLSEGSSPELTAWNPDFTSSIPDPYIESIAIDNTNIYVVGGFEEVNGNSRNNAAAFSLSNKLITPWNPNADDIVRSITFDDDEILMGGRFLEINTFNRKFIGSVDKINGINTTSWDVGFSFNDDTGETVEAIVRDSERVYIGGTFDSLDGDPNYKYLLIFDPTIPIVPTDTPAVPAPPTNTPIPTYYFSVNEEKLTFNQYDISHPQLPLPIGGSVHDVEQVLFRVEDVELDDYYSGDPTPDPTSNPEIRLVVDLNDDYSGYSLTCDSPFQLYTGTPIDLEATCNDPNPIGAPWGWGNRGDISWQFYIVDDSAGQSEIFEFGNNESDAVDFYIPSKLSLIEQYEGSDTSTVLPAGDSVSNGSSVTLRLGHNNTMQITGDEATDESGYFDNGFLISYYIEFGYEFQILRLGELWEETDPTNIHSQSITDFAKCEEGDFISCDGTDVNVTFDLPCGNDYMWRVQPYQPSDRSNSYGSWIYFNGANENIADIRVPCTDVESFFSTLDGPDGTLTPTITNTPTQTPTPTDTPTGTLTPTLPATETPTPTDPPTVTPIPSDPPTITPEDPDSPTVTPRIPTNTPVEPKLVETSSTVATSVIVGLVFLGLTTSIHFILRP